MDQLKQGLPVQRQEITGREGSGEDLRHCGVGVKVKTSLTPPGRNQFFLPCLRCERFGISSKSWCLERRIHPRRSEPFDRTEKVGNPEVIFMLQTNEV